MCFLLFNGDVAVATVVVIDEAGTSLYCPSCYGVVFDVEGGRGAARDGLPARRRRHRRMRGCADGCHVVESGDGPVTVIRGAGKREGEVNRRAVGEVATRPLRADRDVLATWNLGVIFRSRWFLGSRPRRFQAATTASASQ